MRRALMIASALALSACGSLGSLGSIGSLGGGGERVVGAQSRQSLPSLVPAEKRQLVQDTRGLAAAITSAELTATPGGAILRATGQAAAPGSYNAELTPAGRDGDTLVFALRMNAQPGARITPAQITVARMIADEDLRGVRAVRIVTASGSRTLRR